MGRIVKQRKRQFSQPPVGYGWIYAGDGDVDTGTTHTCLTAADFTAALTNCARGDTIVLRAGNTFAGNFVLPSKGAGTDYITIRSSALDQLPTTPGGRVDNTMGALMPKIISENANPALSFAASASYWKLKGLNVTNIGGMTATSELVQVGIYFPHSVSPHHIVFDRCWVHEATNDTTTPTSYYTTADVGIDLDSCNNITIVGCRIAGFRSTRPDAYGEYDARAAFAIKALQGTQYVLVENNFLEGWFSSIFMGGGGEPEPIDYATITSPSFDINTHTGSATFSNTSNLSVGKLMSMRCETGMGNEGLIYQCAQVTGINGSVVSFKSYGSMQGDLTGGNYLRQTPMSPGKVCWSGYINRDWVIYRNDMYEEPVSYGAWLNAPLRPGEDTHSGGKGFIECKLVDTCLVEGNVMSGWPQIMYFNARNQANMGFQGMGVWNVVSNVTIRNNWFKLESGISNAFQLAFGFLGEDYDWTTGRSVNLVVENNLCEMGQTYFLGEMTSFDGVRIRNNTFPGKMEIVSTQGAILTWNPLAIYGGLGVCPVLNFDFRDNIFPWNEYGLGCVGDGGDWCWPSWIFNNNLIYDNRTSTYDPIAAWYPTNNFQQNFSLLGFTDTANHNWRLAPGSLYKLSGSDGKDPGVDYDALELALGRSVA